MKTLIPILIFSILATSCDRPDKKIKQVNMVYQNKLLETKKHYPFDNWRKSFDDVLTQYTEENCTKTKKVFDDLIDDLIGAGENVSEDTKVEFFKKAILKTNDLNDQVMKKVWKVKFIFFTPQLNG
jgi:hypothetical protein